MKEFDIKNVVKIVLISLDHCLDGCKDIQEVKKKIEALIFLGDDKSDDEIYRKDIQALREAITAIDLRTPKKPKKSAFTGNYICPNCLAVTKPKTERLYYCIWCGQALHM